ncbi:hypothetical protein A9995_11660 [Erythrobacter sp. QSSC1-22B]|nr:hypothetical protein A9995_11660 [Erythrobacter sp. QSSC1-22B]
MALLGCILAAGCSPSSPEDRTESELGGRIDKQRVGEIVGMIDGSAYRGETLDMPSEGTSTAEFMAIGPMTMLTIQAHDPAAESMMHNVFSVNISLMGDDASASVSEAAVSYFPEGMSAPFFMNEGNETETEVIVESLSLEDGVASVAGRFVARLCRKADAFSEADAGNCVDTEGQFETALLNRE